MNPSELDVRVTVLGSRPGSPNHRVLVSHAGSALGVALCVGREEAFGLEQLISSPGGRVGFLLHWGAWSRHSRHARECRALARAYRAGGHVLDADAQEVLAEGHERRREERHATSAMSAFDLIA